MQFPPFFPLGHHDMQITSVGRDEGETEVSQNKNLFINVVNSDSSSHKVPKVPVRKVSVAKWDDELKLGVVIENKGCIWKNTGIIRNGKLYCHIEELLFLVDKGALILRNIDNTTIGVKDVILKVASGTAGCSWEAFLAYRHLKSLGYIVGRYNAPWTVNNREVENACDWNSGHDLQVEEQISTLISDMQITELKPTFNVHFPNSGFKKSSPGDPGFILSVLWERPPSRLEAETLQKKCGRIPLKFCFVDHGRISFFAHQNFVLTTLQEIDNEEIPEGSQSISSLLAVIDNETSSSKIQCSNQVATNGYPEELKSEVIEKTSDRKGNLDFHIKKTLSSVDEEVQRLECIDDISLSKVEISSKLADEKCDCSWEVFEAYDCLTSLGYIVEFFNFPRIIKSYKGDLDPNTLEFTDCNVKDDHKVKEICTLKDMQISGLRPTFNVYYRNGTSKKISSGYPSFIVCIVREKPPSREEAENLQKKCGNVPLKFCFVDDRHRSERRSAVFKVACALLILDGKLHNFVRDDYQGCYVHLFFQNDFLK